MIIALGGKSCSGKNQVAKLLEEKGTFRAIDFDKLAHTALEESVEELKKLFGEKVIDKEGSRVDRKALGDLVFNNPDALKKLEDVIHPAVDSLASSMLDTETHWILNVPLLHRSSLVRKADCAIWVNSFSFIRMRRALKRDNRGKKAIKMRFKAQKKFSIKKVDFINPKVDIYHIWNNGNFKSLSKKVDRLLRYYKKRSYITDEIK